MGCRVTLFAPSDTRTRLPVSDGCREYRGLHGYEH